MDFFKINKSFLPLKIHYFLFNAGTGVLQPVMPVYATFLGFSYYTVGIIFTVLPVAGLILKPAMGAVADRFQAHRAVLVIWEIIVLLSYFCIKFIPKIPGKGIDDPVENPFEYYQFWLFLILLIGTWAGTTVVTTLTDTICIEIAGKNLYGQQRLWGSIGWGIFCIATGFLVDGFSDGPTKNYDPAFYLLLGPLVIDVILSCFIKMKIPELSENIAKDVWDVLQQPRPIFFMMWSLSVGISLGLLGNYLYILLEELAGADHKTSVIKTIEGLVSASETLIGEAPAFFFGNWVVSKIGHAHSISVVLGLIATRYTLYSFLTNPWLCLPIELLQSNHALFYTTMTSYAKKIAKPGTEATVQSAICAACEGIGIAVGSYVAGVLTGINGVGMTFRIFGIFFYFLVISSELVEFVLKQLEKQQKKKQIASDMPQVLDVQKLPDMQKVP